MALQADHDCDDYRRRFGVCPKCTAEKARREAREAAEAAPAPRARRPARKATGTPPAPALAKPEPGEVPCGLCGQPLDPRDRTVWRKMTGWVQWRTKGINTIALRDELHEYAHHECIRAARAGIALGQERIFKESG